ncbi:hypothetical protein ITJ86_00300 [Winogradskyella sp. F6397]|uniref:Four helix bundle protein n=1 Tax=Winogradskyella marina TaxID=2785530 RepID=A0ABS0ED39_9FLAO|nr:MULTISPECIES: hypothetical protein [Winogradskyella]MBF8148314.1 hypothetical protein [Winogradskyella marina]
MSYHLPTQFSDLPIYQKAMDIIVLSRSISTYLNQDLSYLNSDGSEDEHIYFTGDIIQQSTNLAPQIISAERENCSDKKSKHLESLDRLTTRLYSNCRRLEKSNSNGRDYLPILRGELKKFKKLQRTWMLTL